MVLGPAYWDSAEKLADMKRQHIDISVISPSNPWADEFDVDTSVELSKRMNDDIANFVRLDEQHFKGLGTLPLKDSQASLQELERCVKELGLNGIIVGANVDGKSIGSPEYQPILQRAASYGIPVFVHPSTPAGVEKMGNFRLVTLLGFLFDTSLNVAEMIFQGCLERIPNIKLVIAHQGAALPYTMGRLDQAFLEIPECRQNITKKPSDYIKQMFFDTVSYDDSSLRFALKLFGSRKLLFGSDYPFRLGGGKNDPTTIVKVIDEAGLDPQAKDEVMWRNATELLRL
jgi:aminocarboxymuconate-semialdehyde decarboxylase